MRLFIDLSPNYAPHELVYSKGLQPSELGGQISFDKWFFRLAAGLQPAWVILAVWARRKAIRHSCRNFVLCQHILYLKMVCLHYVITEMDSFQ
jgi:hypothetical protein